MSFTAQVLGLCRLGFIRSSAKGLGFQAWESEGLLVTGVA